MPLFTNEEIIQNTPLPVSGPLTDTELRATPVPVSGSVTAVGPLTDTELRATPVPVSGPLTDTQLRATPVPVIQGSSANATVTNVSVGTTSTTISASNVGKTKVVIYNEAGTLFVKLGTTASSVSYSYRLTANTTLELTGYYGRIDAIKASGTTAVLVTEIGI